MRKEVGLIAERWKWSESEIMNMPSRLRHSYVKDIIEINEKEAEANRKANGKT